MSSSVSTQSAILRAALAVHARDVRAGLLDVLQVHVEEAVGELVDRGDRVVALGRPPARVDRRAEHVGRRRSPRAPRSASARGGSRARTERRARRAPPQRRRDRSATMLAEAGDQVDVEVVREAARGLDVGGRRPDAPGEADEPNAVARERVTRDRDVVGRRPAPVEMAEPEVDRVEADVGDRREQGVEARREVTRAARRRRSSRRRTGPTRSAAP